MRTKLMLVSGLVFSSAIFASARSYGAASLNGQLDCKSSQAEIFLDEEFSFTNGYVLFGAVASLYGGPQANVLRGDIQIVQPTINLRPGIATEFQLRMNSKNVVLKIPQRNYLAPYRDQTGTSIALDEGTAQAATCTFESE